MDETKTIDRDRIIQVNIEEEMQTSYIDYSMSVIVARALPDVEMDSNPCIDVSCTVCSASAIRATIPTRNAHA